MTGTVATRTENAKGEGSASMTTAQPRRLTTLFSQRHGHSLLSLAWHHAIDAHWALRWSSA